MRSENEGRILKHYSVVRDFETVEVKNTEGVHEVLFLKNWQLSNCSTIVFLQNKKTGQVLGASKLELN